MKILMILSKCPYNDIRVQKERKALQAAGHEVEVLWFNQVDNETGKKMGGPKPYLVIKWSIGCYKVFSHEEDWDAIHCHDLDTLLMGILIKRRIGCKLLVYDSHEYYLWTFRRFRDKLGYPYFWLLQFIAQRYVDHLIVISETMRQYFLRRYNFKQITIVRNTQ